MKRYGLKKAASFLNNPALTATEKGLSSATRIGGTAARTGLGVVLGGIVIKQVLDKIKNNTTQKQLIEDLSLNDPVLNKIDKATLMEWYASVCYYAPGLSRDRQTVVEVLRNFARFGKVDINTLKMLADTEKSIHDVNGKGSVGFSSLLNFAK